MRELESELVIVTQSEHVQWLTGARFGLAYQPFSPVAALDIDGHATLVAPVNRGRPTPAGFAADSILPYEAQWHSTMRNDQRDASSQVLLQSLSGKIPKRVGVEFSSFGPHLAAEVDAELLDIEPILYYLRRRKDADELRMMRKAIDATRLMYEHARKVIEPGINELDLYNQLHAVAVKEFGEPATYFGQDFQCNARGGPPRDRAAEEGELYILDLGAGFRGYFSDNARTICVGAAPSDAQQRAWDQIQKVFALVASYVKPGASCSELFEQAQAILGECQPWRFDHHLGHGVGLFPHEAPHLNPNWDDVFEEGDFFTAEPGLYHDELRSGMRLEHNYLVTADGVELLTDFPLEL
jgi:Xaa-Pro aminopeptidase